jgi:hypothetical protein
MPAKSSFKAHQKHLKARKQKFLRLEKYQDPLSGVKTHLDYHVSRKKRAKKALDGSRPRPEAGKLPETDPIPANQAISATSEDVSRGTLPQFEHTIQIYRLGDRPLTNVEVDGKLWASIWDDQLLPAANHEPARVAEWARNVAKSLTRCFDDGVDIWAEALWNTKHDFLMRCVP